MRLYVLVEGQTEEVFVRGLLAPHLDGFGVMAVPIVVTTRRNADGSKHRGGGHWRHWQRDLMRLVGGHPGERVRFTTLFDLYGLPDDFPELAEHATVADTARRATLLE